MFYPVSINATNIKLAENLLTQRQRIGKQTLNQEQTDESIRTLRDSLNTPGVFHLACMAADGDLACYMTQVMTSRSNEFWLMSFLATNPKYNFTWDYKKNGLEVLWRFAMNSAARAGYKNVVWSLPVAWSHSFARTQAKSTIWKQYTIENFARIEANEEPKTDFQHWVHGDRIKPYPVILRVARPSKTAPIRNLQPGELAPEPTFVSA